MSIIGETLNEYVSTRITSLSTMNTEFATITKLTLVNRALQLVSDLTSSIDRGIDAEIHTIIFASDLKLINTLGLLSNDASDDLITKSLQMSFGNSAKIWHDLWMLIPGFVCDSQSVSRGFVRRLVSLDGVRQVLMCSLKNRDTFGSTLLGQLRNVIAVNPPLCNFLCQSNILTECLDTFDSVLSGARTNFQQLAMDLIECLAKYVLAK